MHAPSLNEANGTVLLSVQERRTPGGAARLVLLLLCTMPLLGCQPSDRRPGQWLNGAEVPLPNDWMFTNDHMEVQIETRPWYGIPHSVTTVIATDGARLFVPSIYDEPAAFPGSKYWNEIVAARPNVRLKVGEQLYLLQARHLADLSEHAYALDHLGAKYPFWRSARNEPAKAPPFVTLELVPR